MTVYIITIIAIPVYGLLCFHNGVNDKKRKLFLSFAFTHLAVVMALRSEFVGTDARNYGNIFMSIGASDTFWDISESMPVYHLYNKLLYTLIPHRQALLVCTAIIINLSVAYYIFHFSENVVFSTYAYVILWFYFTSFNASRQYIALALLLLAACFMKNKRYILVVIAAALAVGVHNTAMLFVPFLFLTERNISARKAVIVVIIGITFCLFYALLFDYIIGWFVSLFPRYNMYLGESMYSVTDEGFGRNILLSLFYLVIVVISYIIAFSRKAFPSVSEEKRKKMLFLLIPVTVSLALGFSMPANLALGRIRDYFIIHIICLIPCAVELFKKQKHFLYLLFSVLLLVPFIVRAASNHSHVIPYIPFWN